MTKGDDRHPGRTGLVDAQLHGLHPDGLAEAVVAVDEGEGVALGQHGHGAVGVLDALLQPLGVAQGAADAVAVVADEVGTDERLGDAGTLGGRSAGGGEDLGDDAAERCGMDEHGRTLSLLQRA